MWSLKSILMSSNDSSSKYAWQYYFHLFFYLEIWLYTEWLFSVILLELLINGKVICMG